MIGHLLKIRQLATNKGIQSVMHLQKRFRISYRSGAVKNMPEISNNGLMCITATVVPGLLIGALISKNMASFLEENELFVPSEDDEDD